MNTNGLAKLYDKLTSEECFRLIQAASARGDETERDRLSRACERIELTMPGHSLYGLAFLELTFTTYIELLEEAAGFDELNQQASEDLAFRNAHAARKGNNKGKANAADRPPWQRALEMAYVAGFLLRVKVNGWKLFCERWNAAPAAMWELGEFPGLDRLNRAVAQAEAETAFRTAADVARWRDSVRPPGDPETTEGSIISAVRFADSLDTLFRQRVRFWRCE
jgi:hypothetical protein